MISVSNPQSHFVLIEVKLRYCQLSLSLYEQATNHFWKNLRRVRRQKDFTQEQLAEAAEISVEFLSNIERGINAPSFETIEKLSKVLGIPAKIFFEDSE
jgi:DNA-binding XRE family transcriptional regulator